MSLICSLAAVSSAAAINESLLRAPATSLGNQVESSYEFVLNRIQPGWVVHFISNERETQKHFCGVIERKILRVASVALRLAPLPENRRAVGGVGCPKNSEVADAEIQKERLLAVDILYSDADVLTIPESRLLTFKHPVKQGTATFESAEMPAAYEMRVKSPVLIPGKYMPEIGLAAGYAGFVGISEVAPQVQMSGLWFIHPRFAKWFVRADAGYWAKSRPGEADVVLPDKMVATALGLSWRFLNYARIMAHATVSAVSVFYRYFDEDFQWAHRAALRASVSFEWAVRRANIDLHKVTLFVEPQYTQFLNKSSGVADWTKQWAVLLGVRYAY